MDTFERYQGSLLGLAVGDAVGTAVEFMSPGTFDPVVDMSGGGYHRLEPGQWTDDTSMALCLAESLVLKKGFDAKDQMDRYVKWYKEGYFSSTGWCFDIGTTTLTALQNYAAAGEPLSGPRSENTAGNGSLMRLAPVPMLYRKNPALASEMAAQSSRTTHGAPQAVDACRYYSGLIAAALAGASKEDLLSPRYHPQKGYFSDGPALHPAVDEVASGSFKRRQPPEIRGTGYVVRTLEAALWAFYRTDGFREGLLMVVNLGDDADTTGAVYGELAGAYYGQGGIPSGWIERLALLDTIRGLAGELYQLSEKV